MWGLPTEAITFSSGWGNPRCVLAQDSEIPLDAERDWSGSRRTAARERGVDVNVDGVAGLDLCGENAVSSPSVGPAGACQR